MFNLLNIVNLFLIVILIIVVITVIYLLKKQYDYYNSELDKLNNDLQTLISEHKQNIIIENKIKELKDQKIVNNTIDNVNNTTNNNDNQNDSTNKTSNSNSNEINTNELNTIELESNKLNTIESDSDEFIKKIIDNNNNAIMSILNVITENQENLTIDETDNIDSNFNIDFINNNDIISKLHNNQNTTSIQNEEPKPDFIESSDIKYNVSTFITKIDSDSINEKTNKSYTNKYRSYDNIDELDTVSDIADDFITNNSDINEISNNSIKDNELSDNSIKNNEISNNSIKDNELSDNLNNQNINSTKVSIDSTEKQDSISSDNSNNEIKEVNMYDIIVDGQHKKDEEYNALDNMYREILNKDINDIRIQELRKIYKFYNIKGSKALLKYNKQELFDLIKKSLDK